jgi:DNA-binding GntR family transcriptional regulator
VDVDRDSPEPPYRQIAAQLRQRILSGELTGRLPSALTISQEAGVAVLTGRKALRVLVDEGLATQSPGMGTYAVPPAGGGHRA